MRPLFCRVELSRVNQQTTRTLGPSRFAMLYLFEWAMRPGLSLIPTVIGKCTDFRGWTRPRALGTMFHNGLGSHLTDEYTLKSNVK